MASYRSSLFFLALSSCVFLGFCQTGGNNTMQCVQKLLPCESYLKPSNSTPPASCCVQLKEIITDDIKCLCAVFNNPGLMKQFNVTQQDALKLANTCGSKIDSSVCKTASTPTPPSTTPPPPPVSSNGSPQKSESSVISHFGRSVGSAVFLISLTAFAI